MSEPFSAGYSLGRVDMVEYPYPIYGWLLVPPPSPPRPVVTGACPPPVVTREMPVKCGPVLQAVVG